jgi:hypothetical protein
VQKVSKKLTTWIARLKRLKWKEKFFLLMQAGIVDLTTFDAKNFNFAILGF